MSRQAERIEAIRRRDPQPAAGPEHVVIDLTNRCNNNCLACWTRSPLLRDRGPDEAWFSQQLPGDLVRHLIAQLAQLGCGIVRYTGGGEPMLHPDFGELAVAAREQGLRCAVTTNGTLLHRCSDAVLEAIDELTVSLWAATSQTYSRLHPNKTGRTFDRVVEQLRAIAAARARGQTRPQVVIANVVSMVNHHEVEAMLALAAEVGAQRVYFAVVDPIPGCTDGLLLDRATAARLAATGKLLFGRWQDRVAIDNGSQFLRRLRDNDSDGHYDRNAVDEVPCLVGWFFARILANGDVVPCCRAVMRPMGNLHQQEFRDIWHSPPYVEMRRHADASRARSPFYRDIGCVLSCDNLMHNHDWQRLVEAGPGDQ